MDHAYTLYMQETVITAAVIIVRGDVLGLSNEIKTELRESAIWPARGKELLSGRACLADGTMA